jgi:Spy/CpxP family protein refolding chaperone
VIAARHVRRSVQRDREALSQAIESARDELRQLGEPAECDAPEWEAVLKTLADAERALSQLDSRVRRPGGRRLAGRLSPRPALERVP